MHNNTINQESKTLQEGQVPLPESIAEIDALLIKVKDKVQQATIGQLVTVSNILVEFNINLDFLRRRLLHAIQSFDDKQKQDSSDPIIIKGDQ